MLQLAFDLFDANDDKKISQLDLFKIFNQFKSGSMSDKFGEVLYGDICSMSKKFTQFTKIKNDAVLEKNEGDRLYVDRLQNFRNMQTLDPNFNKRKEKIFWPVYEVSKMGFKVKSSKPTSPNGAEGRIAASSPNKTGKLYNRLNSVIRVKELKSLTIQNRNGVKEWNGNSTEREDHDGESEEDDKYNQDVFESMVYWQIEQNRKKGSKSLAEALA